MGEICTRGCRFCAVQTRRKGVELDPEEPLNVAQAIAEMELDYVVVTSVDEMTWSYKGQTTLPPVFERLNALNPNTLVEVLIPDFSRRQDLLQLVIDANPDVIAHNVECVERLTRKVRDPRAGYQQSLDVLKKILRRVPQTCTQSPASWWVWEKQQKKYWQPCSIYVL